MKKYKSLIAVLLAIVMTAALLSGCGPSVQVQQSDPPAQSSAPAGTEPSQAPEPQGLTYAPGTKLRMATGYNSASKEFDFWKERLNEVDMVSGTATKLTENGEAGNMVNIAEYLDLMPNFKAYLETNPIVRMSITGNTDTGAIYFSPYFDGVDDIERMPLMRTDWVEKLLNGEGEFAAGASNKTAAPSGRLGRNTWYINTS